MSSPAYASDEPKSFTTAWIATVALIVAFVLGLVFFPPLYEAPTAEASSSVLFIGRFHPILLHLPVGALGLLCLMELLCVTRRGEAQYGAAALLTLFVGSAGAVLAVLAGIMLSREGGYVGGNFTLHQSMGILGTAGVLVALVVRILAMGRGSNELLQAYRALYFVSFGVMGLGAHFGGNMSHGSKFLTEHAPEPIKSQMTSVEKWMLAFVEKPKPEKIEEPAPVSPKVVETTPTPTPPAPTPPPTTDPAASGDKLVFEHVILPIFEAKCNKCHGEEKQKGELRLDTFEWTMKGGENSGDKNIVPGKPADSATFQSIISAEDADEHMPPEGKEQLTKEEVALIKWWIEQGASNTQKAAAATIPAELKAAVDTIVKG